MQAGASQRRSHSQDRLTARAAREILALLLPLGDVRLALQRKVAVIAVML